MNILLTFADMIVYGRDGIRIVLTVMMPTDDLFSRARFVVEKTTLIRPAVMATGIGVTSPVVRSQ